MTFEPRYLGGWEEIVHVRETPIFSVLNQLFRRLNFCLSLQSSIKIGKKKKKNRILQFLTLANNTLDLLSYVCSDALTGKYLIFIFYLPLAPRRKE